MPTLHLSSGNELNKVVLALAVSVSLFLTLWTLVVYFATPSTSIQYSLWYGGGWLLSAVAATAAGIVAYSRRS